MNYLDILDREINKAFRTDKSPFRPALLSQVIRSGSVLKSEAVRTDTPIRALPSRYDLKAQALANIPEDHIKILVLNRNDLDEKIEIKTGDYITTYEKLAGEWQVVQVGQDPAEATWTLQAKPAEEM